MDQETKSVPVHGKVMPFDDAQLAKDFEMSWQVTPDSRVVISINGQGHVPVAPELLARRLADSHRSVALSVALEMLIDAIEKVQDWDDSTRVGAALLEANRALTGAA